MSDSLETELRQACTVAAWESAATIAIRGYGPELVTFLNALLRDPGQADEVFSIVCEQLWTGIQKFGWHSSFRTWAYAIARNACFSHARGVKRRGSTTASVSALVQQVRTETAVFLRTETKDRLADIRAALEPDDQALLILRVDRQLPWRDIAQVFEDEGASSEALEKRAVALRKRFNRLKDDLREQLKR